MASGFSALGGPTMKGLSDRDDDQSISVLTAVGLIIGTLSTPATAEIVSAQSCLIRYRGIAKSVENFPCDFRQSGGNVDQHSLVWCSNDNPPSTE